MNEQKVRGPYNWKAPRVETVTDKNGKDVYRVRKSVNGIREVKRFVTLAQAEKYIAQLESERVRAAVANQHSSKVPVGAIYLKWINHIQESGLMAGGTQLTYSSCFANMQCFSKKALHEISKKEFEEFLIKNKTRWSPARIRCHVTFMKYLNSYAADVLDFKHDHLLQWNVGSKNLFKHIKGKHHSNRPVFLKGRSGIDQFIEKVENFVNGQRWKNRDYIQTWLPLFCELAVHTGMRKGECLGLTWGDIDEVEDVIRVHTGIARSCDPITRKYSYTDVGHTKTRIERDIPINDDIRAVLNKIRSRYEKCVRDTGSKSKYLFVPSSNSRKTGKLYDYIPYETVSVGYSNVMKSIGMAHIKCHKLRHTFITNFIDVVGQTDGNAKKHVQTIVGHLSSATTDKYDHANVKNMSLAMDAYHNAGKSTEGEDSDFTLEQLKSVLRAAGLDDIALEEITEKLLRPKALGFAKKRKPT